MHPLHVRPPTVQPPPRFRLRTLVLMVLALLALLNLWRTTHRRPPPKAHIVPPEVLLQRKETP